MKPLGYDHRHRRGLLGALCRWWYRRRVRAVLRAFQTRQGK